MPGCEIGDIGAKFGYTDKDNGYLIMNKVRISRSAMLSKFVEVTREGDLEIKGDLRILYSVMMQTRITISYYSCKYMAGALMLATRYACIRRQFPQSAEKSKKKGEETRLIDY